MPILTIWINGGKDADEETIEKVLAEVERFGVSRDDVLISDGGEQLRMSDGESSWLGIRGDFIYRASIRAEENGKVCE